MGERRNLLKLSSCMGENQFRIHKKNLYADRAINDKILVLYNAFKDHKEIRAKVLLQKSIEM